MKDTKALPHLPYFYGSMDFILSVYLIKEIENSLS